MHACMAYSIASADGKVFSPQYTDKKEYTTNDPNTLSNKTQIQVRRRSKSPLSLKPPGRTQNHHRLIHHPLSHTEIVVDPFLEVFVIGHLVSFEAGAVKDPTRPA